MKISVITVTYNAEKYLADCMDSVLKQDYANVEYIVVDGGSSDGSQQLINERLPRIAAFVSEKDKGMYDALNKGIRMATGEVIGILNADDMFASEDVVSEVARCFQAEKVDVVYGNLHYVKADNPTEVLRIWKGVPYQSGLIRQGWMPAHPTFYAKKELFEKFGGYSLDFGTAADYELMVRFLYRYQVRAQFLDKLMVKMRAGGMSNASLTQRYRAFLNDYKALVVNKVPFSFWAIFRKKISKLGQFIH